MNQGEMGFHRALALQKAGQLLEAVTEYDRFIEAQPGSASAYMNRGLALKEAGQLEAALASLDEAVRLDPDWGQVHLNRGLILKHLQRLDEAIASYVRAIEIDPRHAEAHSNLGVAYKESGSPELAIESFLHAIDIKPEIGGPYWNLALSLLMSGQMELGWQFYESRWKEGATGVPPRDFDAPLWLGAESVAGHTLLLHAEQGLGDTIQFCRYVPMVAALGARVVLEVQRPLVPLLQGLRGVHQVLAKGDPLPAFDRHCPMLSLPLAFKTTVDTIPAAPAYLTLDLQRREHWRALLGEKRGLRVGLMWSGNPSNVEDYKRSLTLERLWAGLPAGPQYVSLQKDLRDTDRVTLSATPGLSHWGDQQADFTDAAALCDLMDVVISVDTSIAHLAGALGKPAWILLARVPDWRWMLEREDSPWYPSAKLYRQPRVGDWEAVLTRVSGDLRQLQSAGAP